MSRQRLSRAQWRELIEQQRASELSVEAFCRQRGVSATTFFNWKRRLAAEPEPSTAGSGSFVELTPTAQTAGPEARIELVLAGGVVVRLRRGFDPTTLRQVVEALS